MSPCPQLRELEEEIKAQGEQFDADARDGKGNTILFHACMQNKKRVAALEEGEEADE